MPTNVRTLHLECVRLGTGIFFFLTGCECLCGWVCGGYVCVYYHVYELVSLIRNFFCKNHNASQVLVGYKLLL